MTQCTGRMAPLILAAVVGAGVGVYCTWAALSRPAPSPNQPAATGETVRLRQELAEAKARLARLEGLVQKSQGRAAAAAARFARLVEAMPHFVEKSYLNPAGRRQPANAQEEQHLALLKAFQRGDFDTAVQTAEALLSGPIKPAMGKDVYAKLAWAHLLLKDEDKALAAVDRGLDAYKDCQPLLQLKADALIMAGRYAEADPVVAQLVKLDPGPTVLFARGNLRRGQGRYEAAARDYRVVLGRGSPSQERAAVNNLALLYAEDLGDLGRADFYVSMLIALAPEGYTTASTVGRVFLLQKRYQEAERFLRRAAELAPGRVEPLLNLILVYERTEQVAKARDARARAKALSPDWEAQLEALRKPLPAPAAGGTG